MDSLFGVKKRKPRLTRAKAIAKLRRAKKSIALAKRFLRRSKKRYY